MADPRFIDAYQRGVEAVGMDYHWHWRVHVGLWAASQAILTDGDFVECGVNRGFMSSAIMRYLDWNSRNRAFYLFDTFEGLDSESVTEIEIRDFKMLERNKEYLASGFYTTQKDVVIKNFTEWPSARVIVGAIPKTLSQCPSRKVAFIHIDMNCSQPEVAALRYFWPLMAPGAIALLDDYAYLGYESQKAAMDELAADLGVPILSLPTGQGVLMKAQAQRPGFMQRFTGFGSR